EPIVAEGLAEWSTDLIMAPVAARYPIAGIGEPLKRARLARMSPRDPHITGYLLVRALGAAVPARDVVRLLAEASTDPRRVLADRRVAQAWRRHAGVPDELVPRAARLVLIPETRFTIEGGWPDPVSSRIRF